MVMDAGRDVRLEYRPALAAWDVFIDSWGKRGGARHFGRYERFVEAQAAAIVAQHEADFHQEKVIHEADFYQEDVMPR